MSSVGMNSTGPSNHKDLEALYALAEKRSQEMAQIEVASRTELSDASAYLLSMEGTPTAGALAWEPQCAAARMHS